MTYLAHIAGDGRKQTAAEHLNGTGGAFAPSLPLPLARRSWVGWPA